MTLDIHCHLWSKEFIPEGFLKAQAKFFADWISEKGKATTAEAVERACEPLYWDRSGEMTIAQMDEAGIEKTVLLPTDFGFSDTTDKSIVQQNELAAEAASRYPGRLIYFCGVHPGRKNAVELFERAIREWGARGLKFHPVVGEFNADDKAAYPLLERALECNIPLLVHTGPMFPPLGADYGHPRRLDNILARFPNLVVIAAHLSFAWWRDLIEVGRARKNLMCDFAGFQLTASLSYGQFCHILRRVLDAFGKERVLFGTDGPTFDPFLSKKQWVECIKGLPSNSVEGITFTEEEIAAILHGNAHRLFPSTREA